MISVSLPYWGFIGILEEEKHYTYSHRKSKNIKSNNWFSVDLMQHRLSTASAKLQGRNFGAHLSIPVALSATHRRIKGANWLVGNSRKFQFVNKVKCKLHSVISSGNN